MTFSLVNLCISVVATKTDIYQYPEIYASQLQKLSKENQKKINEVSIATVGKALFPPSKKELSRRLFLIHATNIIPEDEVLKAGSLMTVGGETFFSTTRKTVHFTPGALVQDHGNNSWEDMKYAVVTPIERNKLVNVWPADSFSIGNYHLPKTAFCLVREEHYNEALQRGWPKERIVTFEKGTTLRIAIENFIKMQDGWIVKTKVKEGYSGMYARVDESKYEHFDLALPYFYSSLFKDKKNNLSFGPCVNSGGKGFGGLFKKIELSLFSFIDTYHHSNKSMMTAIPSVHELDLYLDLFPKILDWTDFTSFVSSRIPPAEYNEWLTWVYYSLALAYIDLELRKNFGCVFALPFKTQYPSEIAIWKEKLFQEILSFRDKRFLLEHDFLNAQFDAFKEIIGHYETLPFLPDKKDLELHGKNFYLFNFLKNTPLDFFVTTISQYEKNESYILSAKLCYLVDKYFLTLDESYLIIMYQTLKEMQEKYDIAEEGDVFNYIALHFPDLHVNLQALFIRVNPHSNLFPLANKFQSFFDFQDPGAEVLSDAYERMMRPIKLFEEVEELVKEKASFECIFSKINRALDFLTLFKSEEEILLSWKRNYPSQWKELHQLLDIGSEKDFQWVEWRQKLEKVKILETNKELEEIQAKELHKFNKKRFFQSLRLGSNSQLL